MHNIAAFVASKDAGERIVAMFERGAWLDYREYEPNWIQVKIGACDKHKQNLELLERLTIEEKGFITADMVVRATAKTRVLGAWR